MSKLILALTLVAAPPQAPRPPQAPSIEERVADHDIRLSRIEARLGLTPPLRAGEPCPAGRCAVCGCTDAAHCGCRTPLTTTPAIQAIAPNVEYAARVEPAVVIRSVPFSAYPNYTTHGSYYTSSGASAMVMDCSSGTCQLVPSGSRPRSVSVRRGPLFSFLRGRR